MKYRLIAILAMALSITGCATTQAMKTVDYVDLDRFMGDWYVIANIPTYFEKGAHNAVESYALNAAGEIETTFTYRAGGFDGKLKQMEPKGFVRDTDSNAVWGMQFIWPFKMDYRIVYLDEQYDNVIIGRNARDYVWIMSRQPTMPASEYDKLVARVEALGYDVGKLVKVPQQW